MSEIKVNKISPRTNCGTVQLGDSGDTFTIPSGATINNQGTATNFGATGSASWVTTVKTSTFTAVAGEGYFVNTTGGAVTVNLPAGTAGAVVAVKDYANTFDTNACTLVQNGSDKIGGSTVNGILETEGIAVTLVFIDSTQGWLVTDSGLQSESPTEQFIAATGGTVTTCGNFKVHTFTSPGTFCVSNAGNAGGSNTVSYMVIGGGGGGGPSYPSTGGGGGGAGGFREGLGLNDSYTGSPLRAPTGVPVTVTSFPVTVGGGGAVVTQGSSSIFSTITSAGGGGGRANNPSGPGGPGGSGGGATHSGNTGGTGNTPPVSPPQGNNGGDNPGSPTETTPSVGTGGGGAGSAAAGVVSNTRGGMGAVGVISCITASPVKYAGGGGGGGHDPGGGGGLFPTCVSGVPGTCRTAQYGAGSGGITAGGQGGSGTANTGGGAGGGGNNGDAGGTGGSGIVIIRYKFQ